MRASKTARGAVFDMCILAMLAALMFCSDLVMDALPNVHLVGVLTMVYTLVYRVRALIPIYIYVLLSGVVAGFHTEWMPYLYVWTVLWGLTMLLPRSLPQTVRAVLYPAVCGLHGLAFGLLCSPMRALLFGMDLEQTLAWVAVGLPYDAIHMAGNLALGLLILPLSRTLQSLRHRYSPK